MHKYISALPDILQEAPTTVITHNDCRGRLGLSGLLYLSSSAHICIYTGSNSACNVRNLYLCFRFIIDKLSCRSCIVVLS